MERAIPEVNVRAHSVGLPSSVARATVNLVSVFAVLTTLGCSRSVPTGPGPVVATGSALADARGSFGSVSSSVSSGPTAQSTSSFDLSGGTFTLAAGGDQLRGTYTGRATLSLSRSATASLELRVMDGSGAFQDATGTLRGDGVGAFTGDGRFSLSIKGSLSTATKPGATNFQADIAGYAVAVCASGRVSITLQGTGSSNRFGGVDEASSHQVSNAVCFP